jgi:hypothetical protein
MRQSWRQGNRPAGHNRIPRSPGFGVLQEPGIGPELSSFEPSTPACNFWGFGHLTPVPQFTHPGRLCGSTQTYRKSIRTLNRPRFGWSLETRNARQLGQEGVGLLSLAGDCPLLSTGKTGCRSENRSPGTLNSPVTSNATYASLTSRVFTVRPLESGAY